MRRLARPGTGGQFPVMATSFRSTLWRVLLMQLVALGLLWLLQARYHLPVPG
jgi:hypothetical protein